MDLKSMLNDSAAQRPPPPRIHTSTSSISDRPYEHQTPYESHPDRPTPHPTSAYPTDSRPGSYFSPQQHNSASTPSVGAQSAHSLHGQSPGPGALNFTPRRDSITPQHVYTPGHVPPPSPIGAPPLTPGGQYHPGHSAHYDHSYTPQSANHARPPTRDEYPMANGRPHPHQQPAYQMSPPSHHPQQTPSTPLGPPPANYPRPSSHSQRPPSQGYDHLRRSSIGSMGSTHSRDPSMSHIIHHDNVRTGSRTRTYSQSAEDERLRLERERSDESVSPKTIPRPAPHRTSSTFSHPYEQSPAGSLSSQHASPAPPILEHQNSAHMQPSMPHLPVQPMDARAPPVSRPSPGSYPSANMTPQPAHTPLPAQPTPPSTRPPSKKRTASVISSAPHTTMPPRKRLKKDEKPPWAQSARRKPLHLGNQPRQRRPRTDLQDGGGFKKENTPTGPPRAAQAAPAVQPQPPQDFGLSIMNTKPRNDLVYYVCDWVFRTLSVRAPPPQSIIEIEAKLGRIVDVDTGGRINPPILSEAVWDSRAAGRTKFSTEGVMNQYAHHGLNSFLNHVVQHNKSEIDRGKQISPMTYAHTVESDELSELNAAGKQNLPHLIPWVHPGHTMKVRRTFNRKDGTMKAQIIKTRVADLDVYNPNDAFDYRVSISLETPWNGSESDLVPGNLNKTPRDRQKDRLSYKHKDYQIDLTQVDLLEQGQQRGQDHEVEVEINGDSFMSAFTEAMNQRGEGYEQLMSGFIDNIRILAGHASNHRGPPEGPPPQQQQQAGR